jgi:hypothetical protein
MYYSSRCRDFNFGSLTRGPLHAGSPAPREILSGIGPTLAQHMPAPSGHGPGMHSFMVIVPSVQGKGSSANGEDHALKRVHGEVNRAMRLGRNQSCCIPKPKIFSRREQQGAATFVELIRLHLLWFRSSFARPLGSSNGPGLVSGHDFSRAVSTAKSTGPLGPADIFRQSRPKSCLFPQPV